MFRIKAALFVIIFLLFAVPVSAASLAVTKIGTLSTQPFYNEWWYTAENPALAGTGPETSEIQILINGVEGTTTSDALGNWTYQPTTLVTGDHTVLIQSGAESVSFVIHIGQGLPGSATTGGTTATDGTQTLPDSGVGMFTLIPILLGFGLIAFSAKFAFAKA
jgi:hypothetical protein